MLRLLNCYLGKTKNSMLPQYSCIFNMQPVPLFKPHVNNTTFSRILGHCRFHPWTRVVLLLPYKVSWRASERYCTTFSLQCKGGTNRKQREASINPYNKTTHFVSDYAVMTKEIQSIDCDARHDPSVEKQ